MHEVPFTTPVPPPPPEYKLVEVCAYLTRARIYKKSVWLRGHAAT
jgi:hypothetical protein